jgi:hypothetical protein
VANCKIEEVKLILALIGVCRGEGPDSTKVLLRYTVSGCFQKCSLVLQCRCSKQINRMKSHLHDGVLTKWIACKLMISSYVPWGFIHLFHLM